MASAKPRLAVALIAALAASAPAAHAAKDGRADRSKDVRDGRRAATVVQQAAAVGLRVRFNALGTPAVVIDDAGPIATGLSGDPDTAARAYLKRESALWGLDAGAVDRLQTVAVNPIGAGAVVLLRQDFDGVPSARDGLAAIAVRDGSAWFASGSLTKDTTTAAPATLDAIDAARAALRDVGRAADGLVDRGLRDGWFEFTRPGVEHPVRARPVAVPTPRDGVRAGFEVLVLSGEDGLQSLVDGRTAEVLVREDLVDHAADYDAFDHSPPFDLSSTDTRRRTTNDAWDRIGAGAPTGRTEGNNARATENWDTGNAFALGKNHTEAPDRAFTFPWTNQWAVGRCDPALFKTPARADIDAAATSLFVSHNRMHDFSYALGFTETAWNLQEDNFDRGGRGGDAEHGNVQAGARVAGVRDNANQITPPDGQRPITNMYMWQPLPAAFYAPCVDGDFDMSVIGHEYTHAISNRMVAGPDAGLSGLQARAMGESWSDQVAIEYLLEHGFAPQADENPFAVGPYVTGDKQTGIRNYAINASPLNYADVGYDVTGPQVHADGEIWGATAYALRQSLVEKYDAQFPSSDVALQRACAAGERPADRCPGNRRWLQLVFDSFLLAAFSDVSFVDMRDAMLGADKVRFGGANQAELWGAFASRGLGEGATSLSNADSDPVPGFTSPFAAEGELLLDPPGDAVVSLFVGRHEARAVPVADTDPGTTMGDRVSLVPGTYDLVVRGAGWGAHRARVTVVAGMEPLKVGHTISRNVASAASGATVTGPGSLLPELIDDTEATNWTSADDTQPVAGREVTVALAARTDVRRIQVSTLLRPARTGESGQNRFSALRSFEVLACEAKGDVTCREAGDFRSLLVARDAFPATAPRPRAPDMTYRSFVLEGRPKATHLRLRVLDNQCTGGPAFQGDQDADPDSNSDCVSGSLQDTIVRASELQAFAR